MKAGLFMNSMASCRCSIPKAERSTAISITVPDEGLASRPSRISGGEQYRISQI